MKNFVLNCELFLILLLRLIASENSECVRDKNICINGETTVNDQKCVQWSKSKYQFLEIFQNTTLCKKAKNNYWCATKSYYKVTNYDWDYCHLSECDKTKFCETISNQQISEQSIILNISFKFDILIILMEFNYKCSILANCEHKDSAENIMKTNFEGCQKLGIIEKSNQISFNNLHQNTKYQMYILPILNKKLAGSVFKLTSKTKLSRPSIPIDIDINSISKTSFKIKWKKSISSPRFGEAESYRIIFNNELNQTYNTQYNEILIDHLKACKKYCFTLIAINKAGISDETKLHCAKTKPEFDNISELSIDYQSISSRIIKWQYIDKYDCHVSFILNILTNSSNKEIETKEKTVILENLTPNQYYNIQIIPKVDNETGNPSKQKFHTILPPSIPRDIDIVNVDTNSLQINWKESIQSNKFGPTEGYEINVNNTENAIFNVTKATASFNNLIPCRTYCLTILAFNFAWKSKSSSISCFSTKLGSFDDVIIENVILKSTSPRIQWKYRNKLNCSNLIFKIEWYSENSFQIFTSETNENFFLLDKLGDNLKHFIKVRPEFNKEYGRYSKQREIFIGKKKSSSKIYLLYLFISLVLISFVSFYGYFKRDYILRKIENIRNHKEMPIAETNEEQLQINISNIIRDSDDNNNKTKKEKVSVESKMVQPQIQTSTFTRNSENKNKRGSLKIKSEKNQQEINKENDILLNNKYKEIGVKAKAYENLTNLTTAIGELQENKSKNRFVNILPFDQTRVKLIKTFKGSDYINANYIPFMNNKNKNEFIASQGPIDETISHFWQMIWENNISIIVMLTRTYEDNKFKCLRYWPNNNIQQEEFGQNKEFIVSLLEENVKNAFVERQLKILHKGENVERSIIQIHMVEWFDYSAPKLEDFEQLLFRFQEIVLQKDYHPYLIHCSAGVGRTGTFIVLDRIIRELIDGNTNIDISNHVLELRKYRKSMVQRATQFVFIHEFYQYFINKYTCPGDINEENIYFNST